MRVDLQTSQYFDLRLTLTVSEAKTLKDLVQNPVCEDEPPESARVRSALWNALDGALRVLPRDEKDSEITPKKPAAFLTVIDTDSPETYDGSRVGFFLNRRSAEEDILDFIREYADGDMAFNGHLNSFEAASKKYVEYTGRQCKIEEM